MANNKITWIKEGKNYYPYNQDGTLANIPSQPNKTAIKLIMQHIQLQTKEQA
jgi:hypothetical protein